MKNISFEHYIFILKVIMKSNIFDSVYNELSCIKQTVLDTLKTDLNFAKSVIETKSVYDVEYLDFNSEEKNGFQFHVILKDGSFFYIVLGSTLFPDIDFNEIVYIKKVRCFDYHEEDAKYQCCDTLIGNFNCNDIEEYEKTIYEKFNLKYDDEIETGGYD